MASWLAAVVGIGANLLMAGSVLAQAAGEEPSTQCVTIDVSQVSVGDAWTYRNFQSDTGNTNRTWVETVIAVDEDGVTTRRVDRLSSRGRDERPTVSTDKFGQGLFNFPLCVGKAWSTPNVREGSVVGASHYRVVAAEVIETPLGPLETLRVEIDVARDDSEFRQTVWFAPSVRNVVRVAYADNPQLTELTGFRFSDR